MSLATSSILVSVHLKKFTATKVDKTTTSEVISRKNASGDAGRWSTKLLPTGAMQGINEIDRLIRAYHYRHTLTWADDGARLLPSAKFLEYAAEMRQFDRTRERAVDDFVSAYSSHLYAAERQLGDLWDPSNYPSISTIRDKFVFTWETSPVPTSGDFRVDSAKDQIEEMESRLGEKLERAERAAVGDLIERIMKPLSHMAEKLSDPDANFRDSLVPNVKAILDAIPDLNITANKKIAEIAESLRQNVTVFSSDQLRDDKTLRAGTADKVEAHLAQLNGLFNHAA